MPPIISVENLGKCYTIRHQAAGGPRYRRLSEELTSAIARPFRALRSLSPNTSHLSPNTSHLSPNTSESFWALRDVSFDVQQGEVLGIIGRNGAGKSTLLKILSRITEPSEGRATIRGRVASLLEVGTGFHPELTGRENIFLNGAILGMSRVEIRRKFDEIVAFADVEKFLDTPVKHFSSGMYVRLAFAVAAHLEPEILVVDEVLAVGDADFQKKCLGKMGEVAHGGRAVLFVSHNMTAVRHLCASGIVLKEGRLDQRGGIVECCVHYASLKPQSSQRMVDSLRMRNSALRIDSISLNQSELSAQVLRSDCSTLRICVNGDAACRTPFDIEARIYDDQMLPLAYFNPGQSVGRPAVVGPGRFSLERTARLPRMTRGQYRLTIDLTIPGIDVHTKSPVEVSLYVEGHPLECGLSLDYSQGHGWVLLDATTPSEPR